MIGLNEFIIIVCAAILVALMIRYWHKSNVLEDALKESENAVLDIVQGLDMLEDENRLLNTKCIQYEAQIDHYQQKMREIKVTSGIFEKKVEK